MPGFSSAVEINGFDDIAKHGLDGLPRLGARNSKVNQHLSVIGSLTQGV
jgi:hypothetical protein